MCDLCAGATREAEQAKLLHYLERLAVKMRQLARSEIRPHTMEHGRTCALGGPRSGKGLGMIDDIIEETRALLAKASQGEFSRVQYAFDSTDEMCAEFAGALRNRPDDLTVHVVWVVGTNTYVATTGNGPTSEANAALFAAAPRLLASLCAELEAARARVAGSATE